MIWVGTSGFQYPEWQGTFYPKDISAKKMLGFYSARFSSTESNYTFRRMPSASTLARWAAETPETFRFSLKAPQRITHFQKLRDCEKLVQSFAEVAVTLRAKLGAVLFQLPPSLKADGPLLHDFLAMVPPKLRAAFEFRHESWFRDETYSALQESGAALCIADSEKLHTPTIFTANFAYLRLRDEGYRPRDIARWAKIICGRQTALADIYVYFKHEEGGLGPKFAQQLMKKLAVPRKRPRKI
jgi:uncharacterized protein YecE (DUF72 family)